MDKFNDIHIFFDLETSMTPIGAPKQVHGHDFKLQPLENVVNQWKHVAFLQIGAVVDSETIAMHFDTVMPTETIPRDRVVSSGKSISKLFNINGTNLTKNVVKMETRADQLESLAFTRQIVGASDRQLAEASKKVSSITKTSIVEVMNSHHGDINISDFSAKKFASSPFSEQEEIMRATYFGNYDKLGVKVNPINHISGANAKASLDKVIDQFLAGATKESPKFIGSWGIGFDIDGLRAAAARFSPEASERLERAFASGALSAQPLEASYIDLVHALSKEEPRLAEALIVPSNPLSSLLSKNVGRRAKTAVDVSLTAPWSEDFVTRIFNWSSGVNIASQGLSESHNALPDTVTAREINRTISDIFSNAKELAGIAPGMSFQEFMETAEYSADANVIKKAIKNVMSNKTKSLIGHGGTIDSIDRNYDEIINSIVKNVRRSSADPSVTIEALNSNNPLYRNAFTFLEDMKNTFKGGRGGGGGFSGGIKSIGKKLSTLPSPKTVKKLRLGAEVGAIALGMTYFTWNKEEDITLGGKLDSKGKGKWNSQYIENNPLDGASFPSQVGNKLLPGLGVLGGIWWYAGRYFAADKGGLLGRQQPQLDFKTVSVENFRNLGQAALKHLRAGARVLESELPVARVFKFSNLLDTFMPRKDKINFSIAENGNMVNWRSKVFADQFFDAAAKVDPLAHGSIMEFFNDVPLSTGHEKTTVTMKSVNGKTLVYAKSIYKDPATKVSREIEHFSKEFDIGITPTRTTSVNTTGGKPLRNDLELDAMAREHFRLGLHRIKTKEEFLDGKTYKSGWTGKVNKLKDELRWALDIAPKGVHEKFNSLNSYEGRSPHNLMHNINVTRVGGEAGLVDNLMYKYLHYSKPIMEFFEAGNRFLETPFEVLFVNPDYINKSVNKLRKSSNILERGAGKLLGFIEKPHLGLNTAAMKYGPAEYLFKFGMKRLLPGYLAIEAFRMTDHLLGMATFDQNNRGPLTKIPIKAFQGMSLAYSKMSDLTGFTKIAKWQEEVAPGSTGVGFFAFPAAMATSALLGGGLVKHGPEIFRTFAKDMGQAARNGILPRIGSYGGLATSLLKHVAGSGFIRGAMQPELVKGAANMSGLQRVAKWAIKNPRRAGFVAGIIPMLPFLPGLLGSNKSYQERKAEFAGDKDVAIRANRGWLLSGSAFQGGRIAQFRPHATAVALSNYENNGVIWPSYGSHLAHNLSLGLINRYALEEYHKEDQPVYFSAPYGQNIPIMGPLIGSTIGRILKPQVQYHDFMEAGRDEMSRIHNGNIAWGSDTAVQNDSIEAFNVVNPRNISGSITESFAQLSELVGFKGFAGSVIMENITGSRRSGLYNPQLQDAREFYNPSQQLWQYQLGDPTLFAGEFLRRIYQSPSKKWNINELPNELKGTSWIPDTYQTGTTFDKLDMGWLLATRKGWENEWRQLKEAELEDYPTAVKLKILSRIAPYSQEFKRTAKQAEYEALRGYMSPKMEQQVYDSIANASRMKQSLYANAQEYSKDIDTQVVEGTITGFDSGDMTFTVDTYGDRRFRLAGVTADRNDIRADLLKKGKYNTSEALDADTEETFNRINNIVQSNMQEGSRISFDIPDEGSFSGKQFTEAIVGNINQDLLNAGSPLTDTGNISMYNMKRDSAPPASGIMADYWNFMSSKAGFWNRKLNPDRDYLSDWLNSTVFNKQVKLWNYPVEHFFKPFVASIAHKYFGVDKIPDFTAKRRYYEQYWDVVKYVKAKKNENEARSSCDSEMAAFYASEASHTMVGVDPTSANNYDMEQALPFADKNYFDFFAKEPDADRRAQIGKFLSAPEKRIFEGLWEKQVAENSNDPELQEHYERLRQSGGYEVSDSEYAEWESEGQGSSLADYARARFVSEYAENVDLPGPNSVIWNQDTSIENVETLALQEVGEQVQDYGLFDAQLRSSAYDRVAHMAIDDMTSEIITKSDMIGTVIPNLLTNSSLDYSMNMPTTSLFPIGNSVVTTDHYPKAEYARQNTTYVSAKYQDSPDRYGF